MRIGFAGGIGSGKSTVLKSLKVFLPEYKFFSIDDAVKEMYETDITWKAKLINTLGTCDKPTVSAMAFRNNSVREFLMRESDAHISKIMKRWLQEPNVVIEVPLLFDLGLQSKFDVSVLVTADIATRVRRVIARDDRTEEQVVNIINAQLPDEEKIPLASVVVSTEQDTPGQCANKLVEFLRSKECQPSQQSQEALTL